MHVFQRATFPRHAPAPGRGKRALSRIRLNGTKDTNRAFSFPSPLIRMLPYQVLRYGVTSGLTSRRSRIGEEPLLITHLLFSRSSWAINT